MILRIRLRSVILGLCVVAVGFICQSNVAVKPISETPQRKNPIELPSPEFPSFIDYQKNRIINDSLLSGIYESLFRLCQNDDSLRRLTILHIGDSHVQAGVFSGELMRALQNSFGNAGRGLIVPLKLTKTNEPSNYAIKSPNEWNYLTCNKRNPEEEIGIGGLVVSTEENQAVFHINTHSNDGIDYKFDLVKVFHHPSAPAITEDPSFSVGISCQQEVYPFMTEIPLSRLTDSITLRSTVKSSKYNKNSFYGFSLENNEKGVLYHSVGINGATFTSYYDKESLLSQTAALEADLIIVSLGTNDATGNNFIKSELESKIDGMIAGIRKYNTGAVILFTTPMEFAQRKRVRRKKTYVTNKNVSQSAQTIIEYANKNNCAVWDLYSIAGGQGGEKKWVSHNLLSKDHIHPTADGYNLQAELLYRAIIDGYNKYVTDRGDIR